MIRSRFHSGTVSDAPLMSGFYHISPKLYAVGDQIQGNGKNKVDPRIEDELQTRKPDGFLSRRDAMYCRPTTEFSRCGIVNAGYIYRVKPEEPLHTSEFASLIKKSLIGIMPLVSKLS